MPMMMMTYRFPVPPTEPHLRDRLSAEIGGRKAADVDIDSATGSAGNRQEGDVSFLSMDMISLIYAKKVCAALGGVHVGPGRREPTAALPEWARTPWTSLGIFARMRIRLGSMRL